jgi:hypothetical protein
MSSFFYAAPVNYAESPDHFSRAFPGSTPRRHIQMISLSSHGLCREKE